MVMINGVKRGKLTVREGKDMIPYLLVGHGVALRIVRWQWAGGSPDLTASLCRRTRHLFALWVSSAGESELFGGSKLLLISAGGDHESEDVESGAGVVTRHYSDLDHNAGQHDVGNFDVRAMASTVNDIPGSWKGPARGFASVALSEKEQEDMITGRRIVEGEVEVVSGPLW